MVVTDQERSRAEDILTKYGVTEQDRLIGINPGATYGAAKRWPPERYAALCANIQAFCPACIIIWNVLKMLCVFRTGILFVEIDNYMGLDFK